MFGLLQSFGEKVPRDQAGEIYMSQIRKRMFKIRMSL